MWETDLGLHETKLLFIFICPSRLRESCMLCQNDYNRSSNKLAAAAAYGLQLCSGETPSKYSVHHTSGSIDILKKTTNTENQNNL
jgi:hypothetical protein